MIALRAQKWTELRDAGSRSLQHTWSFVADVNRGVEVAPPAHPCLKFFSGKPRQDRPSLRDCPHPELLELAVWNDDTKKQSVRQQALDKFIRIYLENRVDSKIAELNYAAGHAWNVPLEAPKGPNLVDLILALPEQKRVQQMIAKRISGENE